MKKSEIIAELEGLKVDFDSSSNKDELQKILEEAKVSGAKKPEAEKPKAKTPNLGLKSKEVTPEQLAQIQDDGRLVGYDPKTKVATFKT